MALEYSELNHDEIMRLPPGFIMTMAEQCVQASFSSLHRLGIGEAMPLALSAANKALLEMGGTSCPLYFEAVQGLTPGEVIIVAKNLYTELVLLNIFIPPDILEYGSGEKIFFSLQDDRGNHSVSLQELRAWYASGTLKKDLS